MAFNTPVMFVRGSGVHFNNKKAVYLPQPLPNEVFLLWRDHIKFAFDGKVGGQNQPITKDISVKGKGMLHISDRRMVFVKDGEVSTHDGFTAYEIPFALSSSGSSHVVPPELKQPIFGATCLEGIVNPLLSVHGLPSTGKFQIKFSGGGCQTFINIFLEVWRRCKLTEDKLINEALRKQAQYIPAPVARPHVHEPNRISVIHQGPPQWPAQQFLQKQASMRPTNDPSRFFEKQPTYTSQPSDLFG